MSEEIAPEVKERQQLLESLLDASKRMKAEEGAKKRDNTVHNENIKAIKDEIDEILDQLEQIGD